MVLNGEECMSAKLIYLLTKFFLRLHYVMLLLVLHLMLVLLFPALAFIPIPIYPIVIVFPLGPLSLLHTSALIMMYCSNGVWVFSKIVFLIILKALIYLSLRNSKLLGYSTAKVLIAASSVVISIFIITTIYCCYTTSFRTIINHLLFGIAITLHLDLSTFSYVKFRDSVRGDASPAWIPVLVSLWTISPWLTGLLGCFTLFIFNGIPILMIILIITTFIHLLYLLYYYRVSPFKQIINGKLLF
ncbi:hypothetical protein J4526_08975 [Desulfurococcaceae archaeon MEX13E-LK6-19]|nr:hypothetical protein J4526_08975 [Desulfurococcaceae archaeon MEX13E-LK6-19]